MNRLALLWDESQIWGLLVHRALTAWGFPTDIIRAGDIPEGRLKKNPPAALVVPGGFASRKYEALGPCGAAAVRDYVASGGGYLGFCGGAGLALSGDLGLALCPWRRESFTDRFRHLVSGHVRLDVGPEAGQAAKPVTPSGDRPANRETGDSRDGPAGGIDGEPSSPPFAPEVGPNPFAPQAPGGSLLAPVWWPGQFEAAEAVDLRVLARYAEPADDFFMADVQLSTLPAETLDDWERLYGVSLKPDFLVGKPCVVEGRLGRGRYLLSYAHLETPDSPEANAWLLRILSELTGGRAAGVAGGSATELAAGSTSGQALGQMRASAFEPACSATLPGWDVAAMPIAWEDPGLLAALGAMDEILRLGSDLLLLFKRTPWLFGWRMGLPGGSLNNLHALIRQALTAKPDQAAQTWWRGQTHAFRQRLELFRRGLTGYLLAERLAMTASRLQPGCVPDKSLADQRRALFGPPPSYGGLYGELIAPLDELVLRQLRGSR